jgi:hypothetical protein
VDETGQDTQGQFFIVAVVLVEGDHEQVIQTCKRIEHVTGKQNAKWSKTVYERRIGYIQQVLQTPYFRRRLYFALYYQTTEYLSLTMQTIAQVIHAQAFSDYKVTILIDGLPRAHIPEVGSRLRQQGIQVRKVRGVRKEENDALTRLADALCGLSRSALEGQEPFQRLLEQGRNTEWILEVSVQ